MATTGQARSDLGILVLVGYQGFVRELHADLAERGFGSPGRSDGVVMRVLHGRPRTVAELAVLLEISAQGTAQIIEDMERRDLVVRRPDPDDARARLVDLSDRGRELIAAARSFHRGFETRMRRRHGSAAIDSFRAVLEDMAAAAPGGIDRELRALYL